MAHARAFVFGGGVGGGIVMGHGRLGFAKTFGRQAVVGGASAPMLLFQIMAFWPEGVWAQAPPTTARASAVCNSAWTSL
ncbi:DUF6053 domain-containing protein [Lysobacter gummosus]|uniref:DUF6053 domain-containing protein n=1 Tax=Lysobacter gummosus TaxID=262324 RepID=UPI003CCCA48E